MSEEKDFLEDEPIAITEAEASILGEKLTLKVRRLVELDTQIAKLIAQTATLTDELNELSLKQIPELFASKHVAEFKLDTGLSVGIEEKLYASVPVKDPVEKRTAINWLIENQGQDIVVKDIYMTWTQELALKLQDDDITYTISETVNTNSLTAFLREKLGMKKNSVATLTFAEITPALSPFLEKRAYVKK